MDSLALLQAQAIELIAPGHGPWVTDPAAKLAEYVEHRQMREDRLVAALEAGERSRAALLATVWDDIPLELLPMAAMAMEAHLEKLEGEGRLPDDLSGLGPELALLASTAERMKRAARVGVLAGAAGSGLLAAAAAAAWHRLARRPLPQVEGTIEVPELRGRVRVRRDRWGVPHIEAEERDDLFFAQGYCHGQDRLWQMNFYRRVVEGRISEMAGEEGLPVDKLMRTLGIRRVAEARGGDAGARAARQARALLCRRQRRRPRRQGTPLRDADPAPGVEPWRPVDILSIGKLLAFGLSTNWERELLRADMVRELGPELAARLDPVYPADNPVVADLEAWTGEGLPLVEQIDRVRGSLGLAAEASGSNNWAVTAARSKSGTPLIAGDPHLSPSMPGIWYEVELRHGGRFVRGASLPGMPGIYMGQNNDVCWTITNVMADVQDLFVERIEGENYLFEDEWRPLEVAREEIVVKGRSSRSCSRCARPTTARSSTRRSAPTAASRWPWPSRRCANRPPSKPPSSCSTSPPARSWWRGSRGTPRPPRTWSGPTAGARSATS